MDSRYPDERFCCPWGKPLAAVTLGMPRLDLLGNDHCPALSRAAVILANAGVPQKEIAKRAGCSQMTVSRALSGERPVPRRFVSALLDLLDEETLIAILDAIPKTRRPPE